MFSRDFEVPRTFSFANPPKDMTPYETRLMQNPRKGKFSKDSKEDAKSKSQVDEYLSLGFTKQYITRFILNTVSSLEDTSAFEAVCMWREENPEKYQKLKAEVEQADNQASPQPFTVERPSGPTAKDTPTATP